MKPDTALSETIQLDRYSVQLLRRVLDRQVNAQTYTIEMALGDLVRARQLLSRAEIKADGVQGSHSVPSMQDTAINQTEG